MQKYFTNKTVKEAHYAGLKPDQARALYLIAEAGSEGKTDAQLAEFNEAGEPVAEGEKGLKVKTALLRTGLLIAEAVQGERKGSERLYQYTGVPVGEHLSKSLKRVGGAVAVLGTGTKTQFAAELKKQAEANEVEMDDEKAIRTVNGVWLRLQDLGIIAPVKKSDAKQEEAPGENVDGVPVTGNADEE